MNFELIDPKDLKPHPSNNNKHSDAQIERLASILGYQGLRSPVVVSNQTGFIVKGHATTKAAIKAGIEVIPVSFQDFKDYDQEYAYMTSDNAIADWSNIDMKLINEELKHLDGMTFDLDMLGLKAFDVQPEKAKKEIICPSCGHKL